MPILEITSRRILMLFIWLTLVLAACGSPKSGGTPLSVNTSTPADTPTPKATPIPMSGCTLVSIIPTPGPTEQSLFVPVSDKDWTRGPVTSTVTIIEYSDFQ